MSDELNSLHDHAGDVDETTTPQPATLGREVTLGLTVLAALLGVLGGLVYVKMGAPGFPWGHHRDVAAEEQSTPGSSDPFVSTPAATAAASDPISVPAQEEPASTPFTADAGRYADRNELATPPVDAPAVGGMPDYRDAAQGNETASSTGTPFDSQPGIPPAGGDQIPTAADAIPPAAAGDWPVPDAAPFPVTPAGAEAPIGPGDDPRAAAPDAFPDLPSTELPSEPPAAGGPLMPSSEGPPAAESDEVRPAAGHEPPLAEPRNAPYGRPAARDRYAAAPRELPGGEGPRAAPSAEHTPLHNVPAHQWNAPHAPAAPAPHESELERELQEARTPHYQRTTPPPAAHLNDLDAPASEFAPPADDVTRHHQTPGHTPTPDGTYTVVPNDSFWTISQKVYGTPSYFKAIQRHNRKPGTSADGLEIGEKVLVPPVEVLEQKYPQLCPKRRAPTHGGAHTTPASSHGGMHGGRIYVAREGDTLFDIARYELGKASRWAEIYDLNRHQLGSDYNYLAPGTKLVLPEEAASESDAITSRPGTRAR